MHTCRPDCARNGLLQTERTIGAGPLTAPAVDVDRPLNASALAVALIALPVFSVYVFCKYAYILWREVLYV